MEAKIDAGDLICEIHGRPEALINLALEKINQEFEKKGPQIILFRQLKRSAELIYLRKFFGDGLFLLGLYAPEEGRERHLMLQNMKKKEAKGLIKQDKGLGKKVKRFGQEMQKVFSHADAFLDISNPKWKNDLNRIAELLLGNPFIAPNREEHAMFMAFAESLRSLDLSRQVGAIITSQSFDILGCGYNEVPAPGGGHYHNDSNFDGRDFPYLRHDTNQKSLIKIIKEILEREKMETDPAKWLRRNKDITLNSTLDFGRPVHAEMSAIISCARNGLSTQDAFMFVTTFPCQNCAKHIIAAGIRKIYFIEPYPKSLTLELHEDAIFLNENLLENNNGKVELRPYVGIGPRRFFDLFALK